MWATTPNLWKCIAKPVPRKVGIRAEAQGEREDRRFVVIYVLRFHSTSMNEVDDRPYLDKEMTYLIRKR